MIESRRRTKTSPAGLLGLILVIWPIRENVPSYLVFDLFFAFVVRFKTERFCFKLLCSPSKRSVWADPEIELKSTMYQVWAVTVVTHGLRLVNEIS